MLDREEQAWHALDLVDDQQPVVPDEQARIGLAASRRGASSR
jgi:hypothetical protein